MRRGKLLTAGNETAESSRKRGLSSCSRSRSRQQQDGDTAAARPLPERGAPTSFAFSKFAFQLPPGWASSVLLCQLLASPAGSSCGGKRGEVSGDPRSRGDGAAALPPLLPRARQCVSAGRGGDGAPATGGTPATAGGGGGGGRECQPGRGWCNRSRQCCPTGKQRPKHGEMGTSPMLGLEIPAVRAERFR